MKLVGPKYQLTVDGYSGDAGNCLVTTGHPGWVANGKKFTTLDSDNDDSTLNCAVYQGGGWWYADCSSSELNTDAYGQWETTGTSDVQASRMLVKLN